MRVNILRQTLRCQDGADFLKCRCLHRAPHGEMLLLRHDYWAPTGRLNDKCMQESEYAGPAALTYLTCCGSLFRKLLRHPRLIYIFSVVIG